MQMLPLKEQVVPYVQNQSDVNSLLNDQIPLSAKLQFHIQYEDFSIKPEIKITILEHLADSCVF